MELIGHLHRASTTRPTPSPPLPPLHDRPRCLGPWCGMRIVVAAVALVIALVAAACPASAVTLVPSSADDIRDASDLIVRNEDVYSNKVKVISSSGVTSTEYATTQLNPLYGPHCHGATRFTFGKLGVGQTGRVEVRYPKVGIYKGAEVGATITYEVSRHPCMYAGGDTTTWLELSDLLYGGVGLNSGTCQETVLFFYSDSGKTVDLTAGNYYYTLSSLNYHNELDPIGTECFIIRDTAATVSYVDGGNIRAFIDSDTGAGGDGFLHVFGNKDDSPIGSWNGNCDGLGKPFFNYNSVEVTPSNDVISFTCRPEVYDSPDPNGHYIWYTFMTAPLGNSRPQAPTKTVDKAEAEFGDTLTYTVSQKVGVLGETDEVAYSKMTMTDTLPDGTTYDSVLVKDGDTTLVGDADYTVSANGQKVTVTLTSSYLARMVLAGQTVTYVITTHANGTSTGVQTNKASMTFNDQYTVDTNTVTTDIRAYGLTITKTDDATGATPQGDASLAGITFDVINSSGSAITAGDGKTYADAATITSISTDASGVAKTSPSLLPSGTYTVKESATNDSMLIGQDVTRTVAIGRLSEADGHMFDAGVVDDPVVRGGLTVQKVDAETGEDWPLGEASLEGAEFAIANMSAAPVVVGGKTIAVGETCMTVTTDGAGLAKTGPDALPYGTYKVTETVAPDGYGLDGSWSETIEVRSEDKTVSATCKDQVFRSEMGFSKTLLDTDAGTQHPLKAGVFLVTSTTTGESHVVVLDENGRFDSSEHDPATKTNANDGAVTKGEDGTLVVDETKLDGSAGTWFYGYEHAEHAGTTSEATDRLGSFPYDTYDIQELRTAGNTGYQLVSFRFNCHKDQAMNDLGTKCDLDQTTPGKTYDENDTLGVTDPITDSSPVAVGDQVCYKLSGTNTKSAATSMTFTDTMTKGLSFDDDVKAYDAEGHERAISKKDMATDDDGSTTLTLTFDSIEPNGLVDVYYTATVGEDAFVMVGNEASLAVGNDPAVDLGSLENPVMAKVYDTTTTIEGAITDGSQVCEGDVIAYAVSLANTTGHPSSATVTDTMSKGLAYTEGSAIARDENGEKVDISSEDVAVNEDGTTTITWTFDSVADGSAIILYYTGTVTEAATGQVDNTALVTIGHGDAVRLGKLVNPMSQGKDRLDKRLVSADLEAGTATYEITITADEGTIPAGYEIVDEDTNLTFVGFTATDAAGTDITQDVTYTKGVFVIPEVADGAHITLTVGYTIDDLGSEIKNYAHPHDSSYNLDKIRCDAAGNALGAEAIAKTQLGNTVFYRVIVTNTGTTSLASTTVTDTVSTNMTLVATSAGTLEGGIVTWETGELAAGASASIIVSATLDSAGDGTYTNTARANDHTVVVTDPLPGNDPVAPPQSEGSTDSGTMPGTGRGPLGYLMLAGGTALIAVSAYGISRRRRSGTREHHEIG